MMKLLYEFIFLIVALTLSGAIGDEIEELTKKYCPSEFNFPPEFLEFAKDDCPRLQAAIEARNVYANIVKPTYQRIKDNCDAIVSDICSAFPDVFLKYNSEKRTNCQADLKEVLCEHEVNTDVIDRHAILYCSLMDKMVRNPAKWEENKGDLCYALSNDMLCTTATNLACNRINNKLARAYCGSRFENAICKSIVDGAKLVTNKKSSWWNIFG